MGLFLEPIHNMNIQFLIQPSVQVIYQFYLLLLRTIVHWTGSTNPNNLNKFGALGFVITTVLYAIALNVSAIELFPLPLPPTK